jgi:hypothetical protein
LADVLEAKVEVRSHAGDWLITGMDCGGCSGLDLFWVGQVPFKALEHTLERQKLYLATRRASPAATMVVVVVVERSGQRDSSRGR